MRNLWCTIFGCCLIVCVLAIGCSDDESSTGPSGTWSWSDVGGGVNDRVFAFAEYDGDLIVGGYFDTAGTLGTFNIAAWNDTNWSSLETGMNQEVSALAVYDNKLIAGGVFTTAGGNAANRIAAWDGSSWSALGTGLNARVRALLVRNDTLFVGGEFTQAGGVTANRVAAWDGSSWSAVGAGVDGPVHALADFQGELIVGGDFVSAGAITANGIASWDGTAWSPLRSGFSDGTNPGLVFALTVSGDRLWAGGHFRYSGSTLCVNVMCYYNQSWETCGSGVSSSSQDVKVLRWFNNALVAGGYFSSAGGVNSAKRIATWNGQAWSALGTSVNGTYYPHVWALGVYNNRLVVGGRFTIAGTDTVANLAAWSYTETP